MILHGNYDELTLGDILPIDGHKLVHTSPHTDVYLIREAGEFRTEVYHKTAHSVFEANAEEAKNFNRTGKLGTHVKVASTPTDMFFDWHAKGITEDQKEFNKFLDRSDNAGVRVNNLRLS